MAKKASKSAAEIEAKAEASEAAAMIGIVPAGKKVKKAASKKPAKRKAGAK